MIEMDDRFESILICAERYAFGRKGNLPGLVVDYITPLVPQLSTKCLTVLRNDITDKTMYGSLWGSAVDAPKWRRLRLLAVNELKKRAGKE